jgi:hypothetical protein
MQTASLTGNSSAYSTIYSTLAKVYKWVQFVSSQAWLSDSSDE